jgi:hypothetical protein
LAASWSDKAAPPPTPSGEFWLIHQSGSFIKLQNDGTIQVKGDLYVAGDVYDNHGALSALRNHYNGHVHPPQSSTTSEPD